MSLREKINDRFFKTNSTVEMENVMSICEQCNKPVILQWMQNDNGDLALICPKCKTKNRYPLNY